MSIVGTTVGDAFVNFTCIRPGYGSIPSVARIGHHAEVQAKSGRVLAAGNGEKDKETERDPHAGNLGVF